MNEKQKKIRKKFRFTETRNIYRFKKMTGKMKKERKKQKERQRKRQRQIEK